LPGIFTPRPVQAQDCNPGFAAAFAAHEAEYTTLRNTLEPQVDNLNTRVLQTVDQQTYASLLADSRTLASSFTTGRVVITVPDGTVVVDTARPDDPTNTLPSGNSFQHFQNKTVNENHNSRIAILDAQEWPCGIGLEAKFSTSTGKRELYVAIRLGAHLDSNGTARLSMRQ
jgi:hypothetical protein